MNTLVLGGTGWVGHHIVRSFHTAGHKVTICSRGSKSTYDDELPDGLRRICADKSDEADMESVLSEPYDIVIDSVPTEGSIDLVAEHARGLKHYLHCSSTGGYAPLPRVPADETCPYDHFLGGWAQKGVVDAKVMDLFNRRGFPATVLRPCYITGPGMLPLDNLGGRRRDFIADILAGKPLDLPDDGQALLQPIHVEELGRAFLLAAEWPASIGQIYNICLERAVPITHYLQITAAALDCEAKVNYLPLEDMVSKYGGDISEIGLRFFATHMCYDIRKAREQLGFVPGCTSETAIEETARWSAEHLGLSRGKQAL